MIVLHPALHLHANAVDDAGRVWNTPMRARAISSWAAFAGRGAERLAGLDRRPMEEEVLEALETCSAVTRARSRISRSSGNRTGACRWKRKPASWPQIWTVSTSLRHCARISAGNWTPISPLVDYLWSTRWLLG